MEDEGDNDEVVGVVGGASTAGMEGTYTKQRSNRRRRLPPNMAFSLASYVYPPILVDIILLLRLEVGKEAVASNGVVVVVGGGGADAVVNHASIHILSFPSNESHASFASCKTCKRGRLRGCDDDEAAPRFLRPSPSSQFKSPTTMAQDNDWL